MSVRHALRWFTVVSLLAMVAIGAGACQLFSGGSQPAELSTETPTSAPLLATFTPTPSPTPSEPTPTATPVVQPTSTLTPTLAVTPAVPSNPAASPPPASSGPEIGELIVNGSFEEGFGDGGVATGWTGFDNGQAVYAWLDDTWDPGVSHGEHAQLMKIMGPAASDRYVGIYQTVEVIPGETYTLTMHGIIRSSTADEGNFGNRIQWGVDEQGGTDWQAVQEWVDPGWNEVPLDAESPTMNVYQTTIEPEGNHLTLFIRGWTKWPVIQSESWFNIDGVSLRGPIPGTEGAALPAEGEEEIPTTGGLSGGWVALLVLLALAGVLLWERRRGVGTYR